MAKSVKTEYLSELKKSITSQGKAAVVHAKRTQVFAEIIVSKIIDLKLIPGIESELETLGIVKDAIFFHDIGLSAIDAEYRVLPDIRTEAGKYIYQRHVEEGFKIFDSIVNFEMLNGKNAMFFTEILNCILEHHERYDGKGYPNKLEGTDISLIGRITAVCDQLDSYLTSTRDKERVSLDLAIDKIQSHKGTRFDPDIINALVFAKEELEDNLIIMESGKLSEVPIGEDKDKPMELLFKPIFDTLTRQITSYEGVMKLNDQYYGTMYPEVYIAIAEKHDLISQVTEISLNELAKSYLRLEKRDVTFEKLYMQVSTKYLSKKYSADKLLKILDDNNVNPTKIGIMLNETILADLRIQVVDSINILRNRGMSVILNNFGSDYSSLSKLEDLNINGFILSKDFTEQIAGSVKTREVIKSLVSLARNLRFTIIADGIETKADEQIMKELGVRDMIGSFYGTLKKERYLRVTGKESEVK